MIKYLIILQAALVSLAIRSKLAGADFSWFRISVIIWLPWFVYFAVIGIIVTYEHYQLNRKRKNRR
jgi:hypothetical protein